MTKNYTFVIQNETIDVYGTNITPIIKSCDINLINSDYFIKLKEIKNINERIIFLKLNEDNLIKELYIFIESIKNKSLIEKDIIKKMNYFNQILNTYLNEDQEYLFKFSNSIQLFEINDIKKIIKYEEIKKIYLSLIESFNVNFIIFCITNNLIQVDKDLKHLTENIYGNNDYEYILFKKTGLFDYNSNKLDLSYISDTYFLSYLNKLIKSNNIHIGCLIKNMNLLTKNVLKDDNFIYYIMKNINQLLDLEENVFNEKVNLMFQNIDIEENYSVIIELISFLIKNNKEEFLNKIILKSSDIELKKEIEFFLLQKQMNNF